MKQNNCYLCKSKQYKIIGKTRDKDISVRKCSGCGLVYLSEFVVTDYQNGGMLPQSYDDWRKESYDDDKRRYDFLKKSITNKSVLDFGCGAAGFLSLAKSVAKKVAGIEIDKKLAFQSQLNGLSIYNSIEQVEKNTSRLGRYDVITMFHSIEHLDTPSEVLKNLSCLLKDDGKVIIETPNSDDALLKIYQNKAFSEFTYWSCHYYVFNEPTLRKVVENAGYVTNYAKQVQRYSLSNHIGWSANGAPGGHKEFYYLDSKNLHDAYEKSLASVGCCDTIVLEVKKV